MRSWWKDNKVGGGAARQEKNGERARRGVDVRFGDG